MIIDGEAGERKVSQGTSEKQCVDFDLRNVKKVAFLRARGRTLKAEESQCKVPKPERRPMWLEPSDGMK